MRVFDRDEGLEGLQEQREIRGRKAEAVRVVGDHQSELAGVTGERVTLGIELIADSERAA